MKKNIKFAYSVKDKNWVGDGFYVHGLLRPNEELKDFISPFILIDYASPMYFESSQTPKGVGVHPHRGFETVTFAYQGEVEHRDSSGGGGVIKAGDVQWMTAGSGVVHEEFHSKDFTEKGGVFEMVQLWVNLPKKHKMTPPKYQILTSNNIPKIKVGESSELRVIAGEFADQKGAASTFTEINMYDFASSKADQFEIILKEDSTSILLVLSGKVSINNEEYTENSTLIFEREGQSIDLKTTGEFKGVLLNGEPIDEPMVAQGPFVMNTREEITDSIREYQSGKWELHKS